MTSPTAPGIPTRTATVPSRVPTRRARERPTWGRVGVALGYRLALFAAFQGLVALALAASGDPSPWASSVAWWPFAAAATGLVGILLLARLLRAEGLRYRDLLRVRRATVKSDVLATLGIVVASGVLAMVPNLALASLLWGDPAAGNALFVRPLPSWAALVALVAFPVAIALSELPTYFGYALPRIRALTGSRWAAIGLSGLMLSLQHATLPLVLDARFLAWRALMFLPFALFLGLVLERRPRLLPYLVAVHALLDFGVAYQVYALSAA